jgi:CheY-specific phosphatase CheX
MPTETETSTSILSDDIRQIVQSVFDTMLSLEIRPLDTPWFPDGDRLSSAVQLAGHWNGVVILECDRNQACHLAGRFLSMDAPSAVNDDVRDVFGELANMVGGNMKCAMTPGINLSMPSVIDGGDFSVRFYGAVIRDRLSFQSSEGTFWVTILESKRAA